MQIPPPQHDPDHGPSPDPQAPAPEGGETAARAIGPALRRGWSRRCPACGGGPVFEGYLTVRDRCMTCGQELHHHRADDMPAWITILVVGHLIVPPLLMVNDLWAPPLWVHMVLWPVAALSLTLVLLPRFKAMVVALQWATRMGGFDDRGGGASRPDPASDPAEP